MDIQERLLWKVPAKMLCCWLLGSIAAVGHDRFYNSFNGDTVASTSEQTLITTIGIAFAFTVKMFLAMATSTAFSQQLFLDLKLRPESIDNIDALFDILKNALRFGNLPLIFRHWRLGLIALITWLLPVGSIFTPGTVQIEQREWDEINVPLTVVQPQQSWIGKQDFAALQIDDTAIWTYDHEHTYANVINNGPTGDLAMAAIGSISRREILPIPPSSVNVSYSITFYGPSLSCESLSDADLATFNTSLSEAYATRSLPGARTIQGGVQSISNPQIFELKYNAWIEANLTSQSLGSPNWNNETNATSSIYRPNRYNKLYFYFSKHLAENTEAVLLSCQLHNATYDVAFNYTSLEQRIYVQSVKKAELLPYNGTVDINTPDYGTVVYNTVLWAFNNICVGAAINNTGSRSGETSITYYGGMASISALRTFIESNDDVKPSETELIDTIETMFHNITISTMALPSLRKSTDQSTPVIGSRWRSANVYIYHPENLYIAYGTAMLVSLLCVLWGTLVILHYSGAAYSQNFSTILRTTRRKDIDDVFDKSWQKGEEPIPKGLKHVKLRYRVGFSHASQGFEVVANGSENKTGSNADAGSHVEINSLALNDSRGFHSTDNLESLYSVR